MQGGYEKLLCSVVAVWESRMPSSCPADLPGLWLVVTRAHPSSAHRCRCGRWTTGSARLWRCARCRRRRRVWRAVCAALRNARPTGGRRRSRRGRRSSLQVSGSKGGCTLCCCCCCFARHRCIPVIAAVLSTPLLPFLRAFYMLPACRSHSLAISLVCIIKFILSNMSQVCSSNSFIDGREAQP